MGWVHQPPLVLLGVKNLPADVKEAGSIPGSGRSPGREHGNQLQHCCLESPMDRAAWPGYSPRDRKELYTTEEAEHTHMPWVHQEMSFFFLFYKTHISRELCVMNKVYQSNPNHFIVNIFPLKWERICHQSQLF